MNRFNPAPMREPEPEGEPRKEPPRHQNGKRKALKYFFFTLLFIVIGNGVCWIFPRTCLPTRGGLYFPGKGVKLTVPAFAQGNPLWGNDRLGDTQATLREEGCAVTSAAMVLASYGIDTDPKRLNEFLSTHGGYVGSGWLVWEKAAEFTPGVCEKAYEDEASFARMDWNLLNGNPVIVRIRFPNGVMHFVVVMGKQGRDYLIRDPASTKYGVYPLRRLAQNIEALRYYRRLAAGERPTVPAQPAPGEKPPEGKP